MVVIGCEVQVMPAAPGVPPLPPPVPPPVPVPDWVQATSELFATSINHVLVPLPVVPPVLACDVNSAIYGTPPVGGVVGVPPGGVVGVPPGGVVGVPPGGVVGVPPGGVFDWAKRIDEGMPSAIIAAAMGFKIDFTMLSLKNKNPDAPEVPVCPARFGIQGEQRIETQ